MNARINQGLAVLIRPWSNNKMVEKATARALATGAAKVILVIKDEDESHRGEVENRLAGLIESCGDRIVLLPMCQGWTWSNSLNYGFDEIRRHNLKAIAQGKPTIDFVLNASTETLLDPEHVDAMLAEIVTDEQFGAVGATLVGRMNGNTVNLGRSYLHPRNTMMLVRFTAYQDIGGYSPRCDVLGGMEDLEWLVRLAEAGGKWSQLDLKVPIIIGENHHQPTKEKRENEAITKILALYGGLIKGMALVFARLYND